MRLLIFLLALLSAFFVSANQDRLPAKTETTQNWSCTYAGTETIKLSAEDVSACSDFAESKLNGENLPQPPTHYNDYISDGDPTCSQSPYGTDRYLYSCEQVYKATSDVFGGSVKYTESKSALLHSPIDETAYICESDVYSNGPILEEGTHWCYKAAEEPEEPDPDCPAPTDSDPFSFAVGGSGSVCFPAPEGRQCEIKTDSGGGYNIPISYGSTEPVACVPDRSSTLKRVCEGLPSVLSTRTTRSPDLSVFLRSPSVTFLVLES
ncbi:hypothetical protein H5087_18460, partial [Pseudoalteromonas sp. SR43-7]|nr:hypothetical protein [Pseudoalteromonas sp. SR43-7]